MKIHGFIYGFFLFIPILFSACKDFVAIDLPVDQIGTEKVFSSDETATAAVRGIYARLMSGGGFASGNTSSVTIASGRSADEFMELSNTDEKKQFSENNLMPQNNFMRLGLWQEPYAIIYATNAVLENLEKSAQLSAATKKQLRGEVKFIRSFCFFYLTNLFGDVPLILTTDYRVNALAPASKQDKIYAQLIADLKEAQDLLSDNYPSTDRVRANKWSATALLARIYLYHKEWAKAEEEATNVIAQSSRYWLLNLDQVFLKNSQEAILQFALPSFFGVNTFEGNKFIIDAVPGPLSEVALSKNLTDAFQSGDLRATKWVGTFRSGALSWNYPFKYKVKTGATVQENPMVLRISEQYLIRAEARIQQNKLGSGIEDLNVIRRRAWGLASFITPNLLADLSGNLSKDAALEAVEKERRLELFAEWGHRWLDLKRTGRANTVLAPLKVPNWRPTDVLYPIPATELLNNPNLSPNEGYNN
jgi:hypothetical protein